MKTRTVTARSVRECVAGNGSRFFIFECFDEEHDRVITRMDSRFKLFVEPVFQSIVDKGGALLRVIYDEATPLDCRIDLDHYKAAKLVACAPPPLSGEDPSSGGLGDAVKRVTITLPATEHAFLHAQWRRYKQTHRDVTFDTYMRMLLQGVLAPLKVLVG